MQNISFRRLRKLAGLKESITDDVGLNSEIDRRLTALPKEIQMPVLDALDVLQAAGAKGLTLSNWADTIRRMYGNSEMSMGEILKTAVSSFPNVVKKLAPKHYAWHVMSANQTSDDPLNDVHGDMFSAHTDAIIRLKERAFALIRSNGGRFTAQELKDRLGPRNLGKPFIDNFVANFIESFRGSMTKDGDTYTMQLEPPESREHTMQHFRDIVAKPRKD